MKTEIKKFLEEIKKQNGKQYFLLNKFYFFPSNSLGGNEEETIEEYYNYGDVKQFFLNNNFFQFLELCMDDLDFSKKLDYNLLRKIRLILCDNLDFKNEYISDFEDEYFRKICCNEAPIGSIYSKKYNQSEWWFLKDHYKRFGFMYELSLSSSKIDKLDTKLLEKLIWRVGKELDVYYKNYVKPINDSKIILKRIESDNYRDPRNCFLMSTDGHDQETFCSLVCNNDFLKMITDVLMEKELPDTIIDNIIEILELGINFKTQNKIYEDFDYLCQLLGEKRIKEFDYKRAINVITLLMKKKKNHKIIQFKIKK